MDVIGSQDGRQAVIRQDGSESASSTNYAPISSIDALGGDFVGTETGATGSGRVPYGGDPDPVAPGPEVPGSLLSSYMEVKSGTSKRLCEEAAICKVLPDMEKWSVRKTGTLRVVRELLRVDQDRADKLASCGGHVAMRYWIDHDRTTVQNATWCNMPRLCQACAHARGIKLAQQGAEKVAVALNDDRDLRPWLVTFTVKNGFDLADRLGHLLDGFSTGWQRRKDHEKGKRPWTPFCAPAGSIFSAEIKRGRQGGWHPHLHCLWLVPASDWKWHSGKTGDELEPNEHRRLADEWHSITGDSYVVNAKPLKTAMDMEAGEPVNEEYLVAELFEVFKYLTKPGETSPADVVHAWQTTIGKRLVRSHGCVRGLQIPEVLNDEPLGGPAWEVWFRWWQGRYQRSGTKFVEGTQEHVERSNEGIAA